MISLSCALIPSMEWLYSVLSFQNLDFQALEETTEYDGGYTRDSLIIRYGFIFSKGESFLKTQNNRVCFRHDVNYQV